MNTIDMYSREKANQAHLDEMRRAVRGSHPFAGTSRADEPHFVARQRLNAVWVVEALVVTLAVLLAAASLAGLFA